MRPARRTLAAVALHLPLLAACGPSASPPPLAPPTAATAASPPAQAGPPRPALADGCDGEAYHRLDFWLGDWEVTTPDQKYDGHDLVEKTLGGCAIEEHWIAADGSRGDSLFYVDRATGLWRQAWVTDGGPMKEKAEQPGAVAGAVRFQGRISTPRGPALDRTTLTPLEGGRVRQVIEQSADEGKTWHSWEGVYARHAKSCDTPEHHEMDFWLGDWKLTVRARKDPKSDEWSESTGFNHVTSLMNGCVVAEHFIGSGGPAGVWQGESHSMYSAMEKRWRQTWVDDGGSYIALTGGKVGEDFVLVGEPRPNHRVMRMVYTSVTHDHLVWRWERSDDEGKTWAPMMIIDYRRA